MTEVPSGSPVPLLREIGAGCRHLDDSVHAMLRNRTLPLRHYIFRTAFISALPLLGAAALPVPGRLLQFSDLPSLSGWAPGQSGGSFALELAGTLLLVPAVSMGFALLLVRLLRGTRLPAPLIPVVVALAWGYASLHEHGILVGLATTWAYYCFITVVIVFEKPSLDRAWLIATAVHGLHLALVLPAGVIP